MKRVVISAMDVTTSIGTGIDKFWQAAVNGTSGIRRIQSYDPSPYPTQIAGEISDFSLEKTPQYNKPKRYSKAARYALFCAHQAIAKSGLSPQELTHAGTFIGTGLGGSPEAEEAYRAYFDQTWKKIPALTITRGMPNSIANSIAIAFGATGPNFTVTNACMSSADAIGRAYEQIKWGKLPLAICGGTESMLWESMMAAWCKLRVMSTANEFPEKACKPFDLHRDGMVMADGCGILILEDYDHATARGAKPIAEIIGFGSSCDAHHITAPNSDGQIKAITQAMDEARVSPTDIQYINAHGTATLLNDVTETKTIKHIFQNLAYDIPVSSLKSMIGHSIGASGALEIIATCLMLQHGTLLPTINLDNPDPKCDLDYLANDARTQNTDIALSNHFAFGGANAALIIKRG